MLQCATGDPQWTHQLGHHAPVLCSCGSDYSLHDCNADHLAFRKAMLARDMSIWEGLHISPCGAPSRGAKLYTYLRWVAQPDKVSTEPYYELSLPVRMLRSFFHFRVGAHSLPIEQGRIEMPKVPRHLRRCTFVPSMLSATSAIVSLFVLHFRAFGSNMQGFLRLLMLP